MAAKRILLALLILGNYPLYRLLFRALFSKALSAAEARAEGEPGPGQVSHDQAAHDRDPGEVGARKKAGLSLLFDPEFLRDGGGELKIFLLLFAAAIIVYAEYSLILGLFPALAVS